MAALTGVRAGKDQEVADCWQRRAEVIVDVDQRSWIMFCSGRTRMVDGFRVTGPFGLARRLPWYGLCTSSTSSRFGWLHTILWSLGSLQICLFRPPKSPCATVKLQSTMSSIQSTFKDSKQQRKGAIVDSVNHVPPCVMAFWALTLNSSSQTRD